VARYDFWRTMPRSSYALFLAAVFVLFLPAGWLTDIPLLGANSPQRLAATALVSGFLAVAYVVVIRLRRRFLTAALVAFHILLVSQFARLAGPVGPALTGDALRARLAFDVNGSTTAIVVAFVLFSQLIRSEGVRYVSAHAEIALASDIHKLLVPPIARRIERFEFRGASLASGAVGGDLIDLVESSSGWTSYVMDVSGHGVAAGLMMGMAKSTARTHLRTGGTLDRLLDTANAVLSDLKAPTMFVTFAGVQRLDATLRFSVAGHFPILRYSSLTSSVEELSIAQLPLAMFPDTKYVSAETPYSAGDLFVILTDGLTEVFDAADREFGLGRVKAVIADHGREPLDHLERRLFEAVRGHGPQLDDQTLLLIRYS
jgi:serine phosphatase RsbU (regulator of sigma subunit)